MIHLYLVRDMVFNATVNNISVISLQSVLLVEEIRIPLSDFQILQVWFDRKVK